MNDIAANRDVVWDYIVIGGGHNGLSAACRLAEANASVLVVEQLPLLGGLSASHAYLPAAPQHFLSLGAMDDMFMSQTSLTSDYQLTKHGYVGIELEAPYGWMNEDGDTLLLFKDFERTIADIARFSRRDAKTYREIRAAIDWVLDLQARITARQPADIGKADLFKSALPLIANKSTRTLVGRMLSASVFELIAETFESDAMRGLWAFWTGMIVPGDLDGTGIVLSGFGGVHRGGVRRPQGGMSGLMRAFRGRLESLGGSVLLGQKVEQVLVASGRAQGVRLHGGAELRAHRAVLASCAPQVTLGRLVEPAALDRATHDAVRFMPANSINLGPFKIDMAVGGPVGYPRAEQQRARRDAFDIRKTTFMTGTLEEHWTQVQAIKRGDNVPAPPVYMAVLSAADPSIAPNGQDVVYLHSNVPVEPNGVWPANKENYSQAIRRSAARFMDGLGAEIGAIESSPLDFEQRFATPRGCYFHLDMLPTRMAGNRPAPNLGNYATPIAGLYLAGAGSHPGGGVSGWPGRLAAERALRDAAGAQQGSIDRVDVLTNVTRGTT